jgi:hypothetical protein
MKYILMLFIVFAGYFSCYAQKAEDSVKAVVNSLFKGMIDANPELLRSCFADSAIMQTIGQNKDGKTVIRNEQVQEFIEFVSKQKKGAADERIEYGTINIDGPLAIVWTPYKFYYEGKFSHCGVNSFHLVRLDGKWKIQYLIDTRRKIGCE